MVLVISGTFTTDVSPECRALVKAFESQIRAELADIPLTSPLEYIVFFPTVLNPTIAPMREGVTFRSKEKAIYVQKSLSYEAWVAASKGERIGLMAKNIEASLGQIKERHLPPGDVEVLLAVLERAKAALLKKQQH